MLTLLWQLGVLPEREVTPPEPLVTLSKNSGGALTRLRVTGTGFREDEAVTIFVHSLEVARTRADESGDFRVRIQIPEAVTQVPLPQLFVSAIGVASGRVAQAAFNLTGASDGPPGGGGGGGGGGSGGTPTAPDTGETPTGESDGEAEGDPTAGKIVFASAGCGACHTFDDAGTSGTVGPNLDESTLNLAAALMRVTNGGGGMPAFASKLSDEEIANVTAYVVTTRS